MKRYTRIAPAILTTLAVTLLATSVARAQCTLPPAIINSTSYVAGDLEFVMGISAFQAPVGGAVDFYLSVYNSGSATVVIPNPGLVSAIHSWAVLPDTCDSTHEPAGCFFAAPFVWPEGVFFFGQPTSVAPGQCRTYTTHWSGPHSWNPNLPVNPDVYRVVGGFLVGGDYTTSQGAPLEDMVVPLELVTTAGVPVVTGTWSRIKNRFE